MKNWLFNLNFFLIIIPNTLLHKVAIFTKSPESISGADHVYVRTHDVHFNQILAPEIMLASSSETQTGPIRGLTWIGAACTELSTDVVILL